MPLEAFSADWHFCCSCTWRSSQNHSDLGRARTLQRTNASGHEKKTVRRNRRPLLGSNGSWCNSIWLSALLFSGTLSRQGLLGSALRARLQVIGVALHFSDDVFRLNLALEATEGVFY